MGEIQMNEEQLKILKKEVADNPNKYFKTYSVGFNSYDANKKVYDDLLLANPKDKPLFCRGDIRIPGIKGCSIICNHTHYFVLLGNTILDYSSEPPLNTQKEYYFPNLISMGLKAVEIYNEEIQQWI